MADLTTATLVEAELAATADYDIENDLDKAKRRIAALRRKLDFSAESGRGDQSRKDNQMIIERQLSQALAWYRANATTTQAQRLRNPQVTHADFSNLRGNG